MGIPVDWIREHMFSAEESMKNESPRRLTEQELKVRKSLEKLSIPEWYLNSKSKPPKIVNQTPIENRPVAWKTGTYKKNRSTSSLAARKAKPAMGSRNKSTSALTSKNYQGSNKSISSTTNTGTFKIPRKQQSSTQELQHSPCGTLDHKLKKKKPQGGTYPRMTLSKRATNIEIVLPKRPSLNLSEDENPEEEILESPSKTVKVTDLDHLDPEYLASLANYRKTLMELEEEESRISIKNDFTDDFKDQFNHDFTDDFKDQFDMTDKSKDVSDDDSKTDQPFRTPDFKSSALLKFKFRTASTPEGSPTPVFSTSHMDSSISKPIRNSPPPQAMQESIFIFPKASPKTPSPKLYRKSIYIIPHPSGRCSPKSPKHICDEIEKSLCDTCKAENSQIRLIMVSPARSPRTSPTFRSPLPPISENQKTTTISRHSSNASSHIAFIMSKKKSVALENIIKKKRSSEKKSLIQDIIEELQEKCRTSLQPTYTSPGSRNFVRKLVKVLERNDVDSGDSEDNYSSDTDVKSVASSTSLSFKDSDSGTESEPRSPTLSSEPDYDWTLNMHKDEQKLQEEENAKSVHWVPVQESLGRTSSVLSLREEPGRESPCISPIRPQGMFWRYPEGWGSTYRRNKSRAAKKLVKIDESAVIDSGYSDRSNRSSATDNSASWSDFESTQNPSDLESFAGSLTRSTRLSVRRNIFVGKSIRV